MSTLREQRLIDLRGDTGLHQDPLRPREHEGERRHDNDREGREEVQVLHLAPLLLHGPEVEAHDGPEDSPQDHRDALLDVQDFGDNNRAVVQEDVGDRYEDEEPRDEGLRDQLRRGLAFLLVLDYPGLLLGSDLLPR